MSDIDFVSDAGIDTRYDQYNRTTLTTTSGVGYNLFSIYGSSSVALASSTQLGTGNIFSYSNSSSEVFTLSNAGYLGLGTTTPSSNLSIQGTGGQTANLFSIASSTGTDLLTFTSGGSLGLGTSSPMANFAITGMSGQTSPLFAIATSTGDSIFTIASDGSLDVNSGAFNYDVATNKTSIERLDLGAIEFEQDAGWVSWIDLRISTTTAAGTVEAYSAQIGSSELLTLYSQADGQGGTQLTRVVVGTTSASDLASTSIPTGSLLVTDGALCVDNGGDDCDDAARVAGSIYSVDTTVASIDVAENYPTKDASLTAGDLVMLDPENPVFVAKYDRTYVASSSAASTGDSFIGVISTAPGLLLGGFGSQGYDSEIMVPVTLSGRVPIKVNFEGGDINIGDRLSFSNVAGIAMKATTTSASVGIALETYTATSSSASTTEGSILVFVDMEEYVAPHQFTINADGNVAIGTSTDPLYKLKIGGDVAATGFINISASSTKKDIAHVTKEEQTAMMESIRDTDVAQYRYNFEASSSPMRLGLIAEEAPSEVLSVDGQGVDIYKLASLSLIGVQNVDTRLQWIESQMDVVLASSTIDSRGDTLWDRMVALGQSFVDGVLSVAGIRTNELCVGDTCVDEATFLKMVNDAGGTASVPNSGGTTPPPTDTGTSTDDGTGTTDTGSGTSTLPVGESDTQGPVVSVIGGDSMEIVVGDSYTEDGATAFDEIEGDVSTSVSIEGSVDTATAGTYTITYIASDSVGNTGSAKRTVTVSDVTEPEPEPEPEVVPEPEPEPEVVPEPEPPDQSSEEDATGQAEPEPEPVVEPTE
ncbi:MAG: hypothetical protein ACI9VM_000263 [Candidatus Azotimanducaceae bacterium]